jgi:2-polyprenyl-6-methoxyphenol hydroxylase-like FAD-dependent oxidoreductase
MDTDVLVVGAGPTGLMLANQLGRRGVRALILDRHDGPALQTRALGVQARTLEIYSHLGVVGRALELGKRATGANMWVRRRRAAWVPLTEIGRDLNPYPFLLVLGQDDNERILGEALRRWGMAVQWNTELVGLSPQTDRVVAKVRQPDGTTRDVTAAWVAGCDGAHSAVREMSRIAFVGAPYEHVFFVADVRVTGPMVPDQINIYLWRAGFHLLFPMRGENHWRVVGIVPPGLRGRSDLTFDSVVPSIHEVAGSAMEFRGCSWFSTYRIQHRRAERFRDGRCFLLGDAAHIHSPVGAQGMNTGLQDAYNLAWKLALVVEGGADAALLDTYEEERIPVAESLLKTTDKGFSLIVSDNWLAGFFRTRVLAGLLSLGMGLPRVQRFAFRAISQTGIRYPESPLSETLPGLPEDAPHAGDRFPWLRVKLSANGPVEDLFEKIDDTRFTLILAGQPASPGGVPALGERLRTYVIADDPANDRELERRQIPRPSFYLLRPDGHVGLAGGRLEAPALTRYISERLRARLEGG